MELKKYDEYAELLIRSGINLQPGQNLMIRFHPSGAELARRCALTAYSLGAAQVQMRFHDMHIQKARVHHQAGNEQALSAVPGWQDAWQQTILDEKWGHLALESFEDLGLMEDLDQNALMTFEKLQLDRVKPYRNAILSHKIPWTLAAVPGPRWAEHILGEGHSTEDLWEILIPILLLDQDNPVDAWKTKAAALTERAKALNSLNLDSLRFTGDGTDLTVGLLKSSHWCGGPEMCDGLLTMPNLPTEEVFTTPDFRRCDGVVRATRPVEIRGTIVKGAEFHFKNGRVTDFDAQSGRQALAGYLDTDPGARSLGEVALVGEDSPIAKSGLNFASILYDENASCHIALGAGYTSCLENGHDLDNEKKQSEAGCNVSLVHRDFMIGSPAVSVTGTGTNGREIPIIRDGCFLKF